MKTTSDENYENRKNYKYLRKLLTDMFVFVSLF